MNRSRSKNQVGEGPKKGVGSEERTSPSEKIQEISKTIESAEARDDTNDTKDRSSYEESKEPDVFLSD